MNTLSQAQIQKEIEELLDSAWFTDTTPNNEDVVPLLSYPQKVTWLEKRVVRTARLPNDRPICRLSVYGLRLYVVINTHLRDVLGWNTGDYIRLGLCETGFVVIRTNKKSPGALKLGLDCRDQNQPAGKEQIRVTITLPDDGPFGPDDRIDCADITYLDVGFVAHFPRNRGACR